MTPEESMLQDQKNIALSWQTFLNRRAFRDHEGKPLVEDGVWGPRSRIAMQRFQTSERLPATGAIDEVSRVAAETRGWWPYVQAKNYYQRPNKPRIIVIHTMETTEKPGKAMAVANWFAGKSAPRYPAPSASIHFCVDDRQIVQCVRELDMAWHASQANPHSLGIEHSGYAAQSAKDWSDEYSMRMLALSARLTAELCVRYGISPRKASTDQYLAGETGLMGHIDVNTAHGKRGHTDPGPNFPWVYYLDLVTRELNK